MKKISRPHAINDALDILSSCYHELDSQPEYIKDLVDEIAIEHIDHAMAYLEGEYTNVQ